MRLATGEAVVQVLNIAVSPGTLGVAIAALNNTFGLLEAHLDTRLTEHTAVDTFNVRRLDGQHPTLRLSSSFIDKSLSTTVTVGLSGSSYLLGVGEYKVDHLRGVVRVLGGLPDANSTVSVAYTAGFSDTAGVISDAPASLREAHINLAAATLQMNPASVSRDKARTLGSSIIKAYQQQAYALMTPWVRPRAGCLWADFTEVDE